MVALATKASYFFTFISLTLSLGLCCLFLCLTNELKLFLRDSEILLFCVHLIKLTQCRLVLAEQDCWYTMVVRCDVVTQGKTLLVEVLEVAWANISCQSLPLGCFLAQFSDLAAEVLVNHSVVL